MQTVQMVIKENVTLEQIRALKPKKIFYGANTCWWTHDPNHLGSVKASPGEIAAAAKMFGTTAKAVRGVPCDPVGGVLFETENVEEFLKAAEDKTEHYGKHGIRAFMAAHHSNCFAAPLQFTLPPIHELPHFASQSWDEYNEALDRLDARADQTTTSSVEPWQAAISQPSITEKFEAAKHAMLFDTKPFDLVTAFQKGLEAALSASLDLLLFCPNCHKQHIDEATPDVCELCGKHRDDHPEIGKVLRCEQSGEEFQSWFNPPHKSHRCGYCNTVWRPADFPTNGVDQIEKRGKGDTWWLASPEDLPRGYRPVKPDESIKENDLYWNGTDFVNVLQEREFCGLAGQVSQLIIRRDHAA